MKQLINLLKQWSYDSTVTPNSFFLMLDETAESVYGGLDQPDAWWSRSGIFQAEFPLLSLERHDYIFSNNKLCHKNSLTIISDDCRDGLNSAEMERRLIFFLIDFVKAVTTMDRNGRIIGEELFDEYSAMSLLFDELRFEIQREGGRIAVTAQYQECFCYLEQINAEPSNRCSVCP